MGIDVTGITGALSEVDTTNLSGTDAAMLIDAYRGNGKLAKLSDIIAASGSTWRLGVNTGVAPDTDINPANIPAFTFQPAATFKGDSKYLQAASSADFDFSTVQKFSVVFWWNPYWFPTGSTAGLDQCYVANYNYGTAGQCSFGIKSGGSSGQGSSIELFMANGSDGTSFSSVTTPANGGGAIPWGVPFTMGCATYDGTQATAANRPHIYLDAVDPGSYVASGTMPANPQAGATGTMKLGYFGGTFPFSATTSEWNVLIFKNRVLSPTEVTTLYNNGVSQNYQQLVESGFSLTGLVAAWNCDEEAGTPRYDRSGNSHTMTEQGGTVTKSFLVKSCIDSGKYGRTYFPTRDKTLLPDGTSGVSADRSTLGLGVAPYWEPAGLNGLPSLFYPGQHYLYTRTPQPLNFIALDYLNAVQITTLPTNESFDFFSAGEGDSVKYYGLGFTNDGVGTGSNVVSWIRVRNQDAGGPGTTSLNGTTVLSAAKTYVENWRAFGSGGNASYEHRLNGVADALTFADTGAPNTGPNSVTPRDNLSMSSLIRPSGVGISPFAYRIGRKLAFQGLTQAQNRALETALRTQFGT
jgi:hypothetical protein